MASSSIEVIAQLTSRSGYVPAYYIAAILTKVGDEDGALHWLDRAVEERSEAVLYLGVDPWVDPLRDDSRFAALLQRVGLPALGSHLSLSVQR